MERNIRELFDLPQNIQLHLVQEHIGGRNLVYICSINNDPYCIIRVSMSKDRKEEDYLAEVEYIHYLAMHGAGVVDVIRSRNGKLVEKVLYNEKIAYICCFEYAKGMLIAENGYKYIEGRELSEYFYNTGKTLGKIHELSKHYNPTYKRIDYFDHYNMDYIHSLLSNDYLDLEYAIERRINQFRQLPKSSKDYGLVHFDFSDGNYHIDMNNGNITVFDFDNCLYCWYMYDLANLWIHGTGWYAFEENQEKRKAGMQDYFHTILAGYQSETELSKELLVKLPLFIDMVLIENIIDVFECCKRNGEEIDYEDIEEEAYCLIHDFPYANFIE